MYSREMTMPTSIRLDAAIERRLDMLAQETGRTKAFYLREIIARGIEDMEDYYRAEQVMQRVRRGEEKVYSLDEVSVELGLDD
jgi:RHH-type transcriptional regulator, rel operon repressor / antitoxin RelB